MSAVTLETSNQRFELGAEEFSLALGAIGKVEEGRAILEMIHKELNESGVKELLTSASHSMLARGLCRISPDQKPILEANFEKVVRLLVEHDEILYINVGTEQTPLDFTIYIKSSNTYCAHLNRANIFHILEQGRLRDLAGYLMDNMGSTLDRETNSVMEFEQKIPLSILPFSIESQNNRATILSSLLDAGWKEKHAELLAGDLVARKSRGSFIKIDAASTDALENISQTKRKGFFFLIGSMHNWVFVFESLEASSVGQAWMVNKGKFEQLLVEFLK
jgi:hypothetical protein